MSYLYVKWNSLRVVCSPVIQLLKHIVYLPGHSRNGGQVCDAVGGTLRPEWGEWPTPERRLHYSELPVIQEETLSR